MSKGHSDKIPFTSNLKKPACASKQDVLELYGVNIQPDTINKFNKTVKNSMFFQIEAVFSFLFKYGQISHAITFLLRPAPAPVTPGSAWLRLTYLLQRSVAEVTECRFLTKWFMRGENPYQYNLFLQF